MPSSSGRSGRAKAPRQPDRAGRAGANRGRAEHGDDAPPSAENISTPRDDEPGTEAGGSDKTGKIGSRRGRNRRGGTRGKNQRKARAKQAGGQGSTARNQGAATRGNRRRGGAQVGAGQGKSRSRRLRTVDETSAGGLVVDTATSQAALIGRLDRRGRMLWSLPKGHIESGETAEQAAIREVAEETGITGSVMATLGSIDYWFVADDRRVHKTVHHFLMRALGGELSDEDLEVTEVAWVPLLDLQKRLAYADERRLVRRAAGLLAESV